MSIAETRAAQERPAQYVASIESLLRNVRRLPIDGMPANVRIPDKLWKEAELIGTPNHPGASGVSLDTKGELSFGGMIGIQPGRFIAESHKPHLIIVQRLAPKAPDAGSDQGQSVVYTKKSVIETADPNPLEIAGFFTRPARRAMMILHNGNVSLLVPSAETGPTEDMKRTLEDKLPGNPGLNTQFAYAKMLGEDGNTSTESLLKAYNIALYRGKRGEDLKRVEPLKTKNPAA